jgi:hypothetical protein
MKILLVSAMILLAATQASYSQDLDQLCAKYVGRPLGTKGGNTVPITCDKVHTLAQNVPTQDPYLSLVGMVQKLGTVQFTTLYDDPKDGALRRVCAPNSHGYLCNLPLGPAQILIGTDGIVSALSLTIGGDNPAFRQHLSQKAHAIGMDTLSDDSVALAVELDAAALRARASPYEDFTVTDGSLVVLVHR